MAPKSGAIFVLLQYSLRDIDNHSDHSLFISTRQFSIGLISQDLPDFSIQSAVATPQNR